MPKILRNSSIERSSAAEYLSIVAVGGNGGVDNYYMKKVFADSEIEEASVIRNFRITEADGKSYDTKHYNLPVEIARRHAESEFEKYRFVQDRLFVSDFDAMVNKFNAAPVSKDTIGGEI